MHKQMAKTFLHPFFNKAGSEIPKGTTNEIQTGRTISGLKARNVPISARYRKKRFRSTIAIAAAPAHSTAFLPGKPNRPDMMTYGSIRSNENAPKGRVKVSNLEIGW